MTTDPYIHLHLHTSFSTADGIPSPDQIAEAIVERGQDGCAITDHGALHGLFPFDAAMRKAGKHPILGGELYLTVGPIVKNSDGAKPIRDSFHLTALAKNEIGYRNLLALNAKASIENTYYDKPRVTLDWLAEHREGLVILSGCISSLISVCILAAKLEGAWGDRARAKSGVRFGYLDVALKHFLWFRETFGEDFFVELMDHGLPEEEIVAKQLLAWADQYEVPIVGTNDVHYLEKDDFQIQTVITAATRKKDDDGVWTEGIGHEGLHLMTGAEMAVLPLFLERPEALTNTRVVFERCVFDLPAPPSLLPSFPLPKGAKGIESYLWDKVVAGCHRRYGHMSGEVLDRATYEFEVIRDMRFLDYFAVVEELISWSKNKGIRVGPGRGSAAGSLVVYALGITDVDPLHFGLFFERFLNPNRISMPDIDIDFADTRRDEVVAHVRKVYGDAHVAQISTYGTLASRSSVRAVARAMGVGYLASDLLAKQFPMGPTSPPMAESAASPAILNYLAQQPDGEREELEELVRTAVTINGRINNVGRHAAGIVISGPPILDYIPVGQIKGEKVVQCSMHEVEDKGLLKMDFLGLTTLTLINVAEELINANRASTLEPFAVADQPLEGPDADAVYAMMARGDVFGCFQLDQATALGITRQVKPRRFDDVVTITALGRPGPMEHAPQFVSRREGREAVVYAHPDLEPVLGDTYGFPVFQEQVMQIARVLAGYSLAEADELRKAMGKKLPVEMAKHRDRFLAGCRGKGIADNISNPLFDDMEKFSGYGFNRSHSTCYALIGFWTGFLSCHYPNEFLAALMTSEFGNSEKVARVIAESRHRGIGILPPSVDRSQWACTIEGSALRLGLGMVKGLGADMARQIAASAPYDSIDALFLRIPAISSGAVTALVKSGACDHLIPDRSPKQRVGVSEQVSAMARRVRAMVKKNQNGLQTSLFAPTEHFVPLPLAVHPDSSLKETLENELGILGCYLTLSPLAELAEREGRGASLADVPEEVPPDEEITYAFKAPHDYVVEVREMNVVLTKESQESMALLTVADAQGTKRRMAVFPRLYRELAPEGLAQGALMRVVARANIYKGEVGLVANEARIVALGDIERMMRADDARMLEVLHVSFSQAQLATPVYMRFLTSAINRPEFSGDRPVILHTPDGKAVPLSTGVKAPRAICEHLRTLFGGRVSTGPPGLRWRDEAWNLYDPNAALSEEDFADVPF